MQFSSEMPDAAVVEKALYELGISVPQDASRRAKASGDYTNNPRVACDMSFSELRLRL